MNSVSHPQWRTENALCQMQSRRLFFSCDQTYDISLRPGISYEKLKFTFKNAAGEELAGLLELPENPKAFALLAHCFTCGKDLKGAARIARKLTEKAIAVLRFDFTGLGNSEGIFPTPTSHPIFRTCFAR
ncbi:hypothetical protein NYV34_23215 [Escherichia coli]|nr:hypothetical protein [Escherichia coli]